MAITTLPGRARSARRRRDPVARENRRARRETAGAVPDTFLDVVVLLSVLMFLLLAAGVGVLALQATTRI
ncbi:MAG: hypothetical protein M3Y42_08605 [Actinomycetota bacterium]|nr:hypothetical protein [Actinomycetota bacterium]MDQ2957010.1 hypothetical protein [Actinomycetota bacterium]